MGVHEIALRNSNQSQAWFAIFPKISPRSLLHGSRDEVFTKIKNNRDGAGEKSRDKRVGEEKDMGKNNTAQLNEVLFPNYLRSTIWILCLHAE